MIAIFRSASLAGFLQLISSKSPPLILFPTLGSNTHNLEGPGSFPSKSFEFFPAALAALTCRLSSSLGSGLYKALLPEPLPAPLPAREGLRARGQRGSGGGAPGRAPAWREPELGLASTLVPCFLCVVCSQLCWKTAKRGL